MDKFARKQSKDPKQESLRSEKENWNEETSKLINELIALKRSLNGRADSKHNLPASSIKESFPSEVGSYLNHVTDSAAKVINRARGIITQQDTYAKTRRRHKRKEASFDEDFTKEASWWGSRFYAKHISFRKLPAKQKIIVVQIMDSLVDLNDKLKLFQDNLLKSNKSGIYFSFHLLNSILTFYIRNVLLNFRKLEEAIKELPISSEPGAMDRDPPEPATPPTDEAPVAPVAPSPRVEPSMSGDRARLGQQDAEKLEMRVLEGIKDSILGNEMQAIDLCESLIKNNHSLFVEDEGVKKEFLEAINSFRNNFKIIINITKPSKSNVIIEERTSQRKSNLLKFKDSYVMIINCFKKFMFKGRIEDGEWEELGKDEFIQIKDVILKKATNFYPNLGGNPWLSEIIQCLPLEELKKFQSLQGNLIVKDSDNTSLFVEASLKNYLREQVLSLSKDNFSILQLAVNNLTKQIIEELDHSLDDLENADTNLISFKENLNKVTKLLLSLVENSLDLGDSYRRHLRLSTSSSVLNLKDLKNEDLSSLRFQKNNLNNFVSE